MSRANLFEGRLEAAGEALAAHGDGTSTRREAESTLFLDALQPVPAKSQPVELVIKVEHPNEERVLEGAVSGGPPPASGRGFRAAATAHAGPPHHQPPRSRGGDCPHSGHGRSHGRWKSARRWRPRMRSTPSRRPCRNGRDDPIEGEYHAVEAEPETPELVEEEPAAEQIAEQPDTEAEPETETEPEPEASVEADVLARVAEAIEAETPAQPDAVEADAPAPVETMETVEGEPLPEGTRLGFDYVKNAPVRPPSGADPGGPA